jgi:hypothetical protein
VAGKLWCERAGALMFGDFGGFLEDLEWFRT